MSHPTLEREFTLLPGEMTQSSTNLRLVKQSREGKNRERGWARRTRQRPRRGRLVGPASKLLKIERHVARLRCRPDRSQASKALYGLGLLCGVGLAPPLATDAVEAVRVGGTNEHPFLTLVTDERVLRIPMAPDLARWSKQHIERHLLVTYKKKVQAAP